MPDEIIMSTTVQTALDNLEDYSLDNHISRNQNYSTVLNALEKDENIDADVLKRLLAVCVHDTPILKYTATVINVILAILSKVKLGKYDPEPDLVPSALTVMTMIKTIALVNRVDSLTTVCYDTLLSYPDKTLIAVAENHDEVMEVFNLYCQLRIPLQTRLQACNVLHRLLTILPPENKKVFIKNGVSVWFSKIIPTVMALMTSKSQVKVSTVEVLEMLTVELIHIDYSDNPQWLSILECICNSKQYPAIMRDLLNTENNVWHRLWIIFIRLLKNKITQPLNSVGTPINSMLPVVEAAFKLDVINRCRAFECWSVLIDSFSTETNESNINKRIKLLIIPLRSNNAKAEETALAKFKCWWHLITKFQNKMDKFLDVVLVSFLNFCFGRHNATDKTQVVPGLLSTNLKKHCNQAIVDIVGHVNCTGCTDLAKLNSKLINTKHLVDNWNHWIYSLTSVIMKTSNSSYGLTKQQLSCLWKSFLMTIAELPENNIRKDLFAEILSIIDHLVQECKSNLQFLDTAFNVLILSLFEEDTKVKQLFKSEDDPNDPISRIIKTILNPSLYGYYLSIPSSELATKLKPVTKLIVNQNVCSAKHILGCVVVALPTNEFGLTLWTALTESVRDSEYNCPLVVHKILLWPLDSIHLFNEVKAAAMTWYTTYISLYPKVIKTDIDKEISAILASSQECSSSIVYFKLCVILGVLRYKSIESNYAALENELNLLLNLTKSVDNFEYFQPIFPMLVDRIVAILELVATDVNDTITALILICVKNVLQIMTQVCKQQSNVDDFASLIGSLLKPLEKIFIIGSYSKLLPAMTYHLLKCFPLLSEYSTTRIVCITILKIILDKTNVSDSNYTKINALIKDMENGPLKRKENVDNNFTTPQIKEVSKRAKKKEASIVNTVVENGEEYVVVKSNWKFNPRKLTENQKEKLQRKREDIPALYQDLSQSQDEFKLVSWKTDSQDTTSSSKSESKTSKLGQTNDADTELLKKIPSSNVVPKILENFFSEKEKKDEIDTISKDNVCKVGTTSEKNTKSSRMALKDRVFRNVRHLIENSGLQKENKELSDDPNKTDDHIKTPTHTKNNNTANISNSAPPLLSADRPSRVKRKPKKFEDLQLLTSKKSRTSLHEGNLDKTEPNGDSSLSTTKSKEPNVGNKELNEIASDNHETQSIVQQSPNLVIDTNNINHKKNETITKEKIITSSESDVVIDDEKSNEDDQITEKIKDQTNIETSNKTPKLFRREVSTSTTPICTTDLTSNDVKRPATPKSSKSFKEISVPVMCNNRKDISSNLEEVSISESTKENTRVSTPALSNKKVLTVNTPTTGNEVDIISKNIDMMTPTELKEVSTPRSSKVSKNLLVPVAPNDDKEVSTPKSSKVSKEISTSNIQKDLKELSTPKSSKVNKEVSTPNSSKDAKEASIPTAAKGLKDVYTSTPRTSKLCKEISTPSVSTDPKEGSTPRSSRVGREISTLIDPNDLKEIVAPKSSTDAIELSTPRTCRGKNVSTPKTTADIEKSFSPKESVDITDKLTSKQSKQMSTPNPSKEALSCIQSKELTTPKLSPKGDEQKSAKKSTVKKSRIEKELAIDMVEGHPFLKMQSQKRLTRKTIETAHTGRRKSLADKLNKSKLDGNNSPKGEKKNKEKNKENTSISKSTVVDESQEKDSEPSNHSSASDDLPYSDDVIESSQDSTITTLSVKSTRKTPTKVPVVCVEKMITSPIKHVADINNSQSILDCVIRVPKLPSIIQDSKDDSILPLNKTALEEKTQDVLTENMDTEPLDEKDISEVVILTNDDIPAVTMVTEDIVVGPETQEIADADTQPVDPKEFMDIDETPDNIEDAANGFKMLETCNLEIENEQVGPKSLDVNNIVNITVVTLSEAASPDVEHCSGSSSPFKDEAQRQQDFLNNTIEISPIKTMSPDRNKKSPSPETSSDYVVITLSSPVHSNGEPFEKCGSPEVFTEDKMSPDKRDQSPPRVEISVTNTSPSSSLSLKKNRPQVRSGGRAAQMLGLCVPDKVQAIINPERNETEDINKKGSATNTPARRNLRILYNSVSDNVESSNNTSENDESENFLKFRRSLPAVDSSPSGPILKRKLAEIADDAMISPASKRKRVSFHDPPVSTTISVQKYIEPGGGRSPQNSALKRLERQLRQHTPLKSPKRLDNVFKLDTVLTKTVESFSESGVMPIADDTQGFSLDETPDVEIVCASDLNDTDPICPALLYCQDPLERIARKLSSSAIRSLFVKAFKGKLETVGDLARLTELEINRLSIKAPKVKVVKKVLTDYAAKKAENFEYDITVTLDELDFPEAFVPTEFRMDPEVPTRDNKSMEIEVQTMEIPTSITSVQTDSAEIIHTSIQTDESGSKSTENIIQSCLSERPDFVEKLGEQLEESSIQQLSHKLSLTAVRDLLIKKTTPSDTKDILNRILEQECNSSNDRSKEMSFVRDYLCGRFDTNHLVLLCSQILKAVYDRPA